MDPLPCNVTLSSQTATITYSPFRDTNVTAGWNVSYVNGIKGGIGVGDDFHQTSLKGASMEFSWIGTAVYLYGEGSPGSYRVFVDNFDIEATPQIGVLGIKSDLDYGSHTVRLETVTNSQVIFRHAEVTIGVGFSGSNINNSTVFAVNNPFEDDHSPNNFFSFSENSDGTSQWFSGIIDTIIFPNGTKAPSPRQMLTNQGNAYVQFQIQEATAFFLWGAVNFDHGQNTVSLTSNNGFSKLTIINDNSSALDFRQILYWESGLDRDDTYNITISNSLPSKSFSFSRLEIIDGGPSPSLLPSPPSNGPGGSSSESSQIQSKRLVPGAIAGIVVSNLKLVHFTDF
ncbi:hypothetical protein VKT23_009509 [Stygiomarasmius scandens]|uniref:Uncharacterized protein n=1 Tax=Marasmiellus scandens TaxID=2682957 RepID=A0ABR1JEX8_9AGAR